MPAEKADTQSPRTARPRNGSAGYAKGDAARQALLDAALQEFGLHGFRAATTRRIAEAAGAQLPAIPYYFENKEGLYLACAESIVDAYHQHMAPAVERARSWLRNGTAPDDSQQALSDLMGELVELLIGSSQARRWAAFVARETSDPGPAYELLYRKIWEPGTELVARLIAAMRGSSSIDAEDRVQAVLLISGITTLQSAGSVTRRLLDWNVIGAEQRRIVAEAIRRQIAGFKRTRHPANE